MRIQWIKTPPLAEFGGFDTARLYQMVPLGGKREIGIEVDQACVVESENTGVSLDSECTYPCGPPCVGSNDYEWNTPFPGVEGPVFNRGSR